MSNRFFRQFGRPTGLLGRVAGRLMARMNVPLNAWAVELLEVGPEDRVLEVGFGPGLAVERCAVRARQGRVAGIDHSDVMRRAATRRNREAVRQGRVELRTGTAARLPFPDRSFDKALSVNSLQFWPDAPAALAELQRVLVPQGRLVLALRMRRPDAGRFDRSAHGFSDERLADVLRELEQAGFRDLKPERREIRGETITGVLARAGGHR